MTIYRTQEDGELQSRASQEDSGRTVDGRDAGTTQTANVNTEGQPRADEASRASFRIDCRVEAVEFDPAKAWCEVCTGRHSAWWVGDQATCSECIILALSNDLPVVVVPITGQPTPPITDCLAHRCTEHLSVRQLNTNENGAECGGCVAEDGKEKLNAFRDVAFVIEQIRAERWVPNPAALVHSCPCAGCTASREGRHTPDNAHGCCDHDSAAVCCDNAPLLQRIIAEHRPTSERVYVASRASVPERPAMWRRLRDGGYTIVSSWIDEAGEGETESLSELWVRVVREIRQATRLVLYAEPDDFPLKGAYIEIGVALASGIPVYVVAPGVAIAERSCRPIGSWIKHPLVTIEPNLLVAMGALPPTVGVKELPEDMNG